MWPTAFKGFPHGAVVKNPPAKTGDARDASSIPGSGRSSGNGNPLQYSCLENSMGRGVWWAIVHAITKEWDTTEWLSTTHSIQTPCYEVCVACAPCLQTIILEISSYPHAPQSPTPGTLSVMISFIHQLVWAAVLRHWIKVYFGAAGEVLSRCGELRGYYPRRCVC